MDTPRQLENLMYPSLLPADLAETDDWFGASFWLAPGRAVAECKFCGAWVSHRLIEEHRKFHREVAK